MPDIEIANATLHCTVSTSGGVVWRLEAESGDGRWPILRPPPQGPGRNPLEAGCFPLVPFGNRVEANRFCFLGQEYSLEANTSWDRHYLHGDGWLGEWRVDAHNMKRVALSFDFRDAVYAYHAVQRFEIRGNVLEVALAVTNRGRSPMPFGLGWHPFFPLTPATTLVAPAAQYWSEKAGWLPDRRQALPDDFDFARPRPVPRRWINNGFEGWNGEAVIAWPENRLQLAVTASPGMTRYFVFLSDRQFDPAYREDFFCFEPMSHSANGHNLADLGGLTVLAPGQSMEAGMSLCITPTT